MTRRILLVLVIALAAWPAGAIGVAREPSSFGRGSWATLKRAHAGRALIVHFWGISCTPCLEELPRWSAIVHERAAVDVIFVAADPVPEDPADIRKAIHTAGIDDAEQWRFADRFVERLYFEVDPEWGGELPYTMLIATDGSVTRILGAGSLDVIRAWAARQVPGRPVSF